jgi:hypothetical protein
MLFCEAMPMRFRRVQAIEIAEVRAAPGGLSPHTVQADFDPPDRLF